MNLAFNSGLVLVISHSTFGLIMGISLLGFTIIFVCTCLQDMQDMRNCYDSLLSAAAATANSAYGKYLLTLFSTSLLNLFVTFCIFPVNEIWYALFCPPFQIWQMVFESNTNIVETPISQQSLLNR